FVRCPDPAHPAMSALVVSISCVASKRVERSHPWSKMRSNPKPARKCGVNVDCTFVSEAPASMPAKRSVLGKVERSAVRTPAAGGITGLPDLDDRGVGTRGGIALELVGGTRFVSERVLRTLPAVKARPLEPGGELEAAVVRPTVQDAAAQHF